jgi:Pyruvate/2-oxoacid:ferredoxin oxidoreductase gamma subunit
MSAGAETALRLATDRPVSLAILAMGGQGGGVLADWIVALAEQQGWMAQSTSVPGVAQRTGATIYYIEMLPAKDGMAPILSLMPTPGDVDVVIAAEMMEAGRSVLRGLVTPDRTVLVASTHRAYAVAEKQVPGDGIGDPQAVIDATDLAARRTIAFDMQSVASSRPCCSGRLRHRQRCRSAATPSRRRSGLAAGGWNRACAPSPPASPAPWKRHATGWPGPRRNGCRPCRMQAAMRCSTRWSPGSGTNCRRRSTPSPSPG